MISILNFRITLLFSLLALQSNVFSQEIPTHEKKWFVDKEGEVYWNKALPVFIQLSSDPNDKDKTVTLESKDYAKYTEPYFFDTEGPNYIRTRWAVDKETKKPVYPQVEVLWEVIADSEPPSTSIIYDVADSYKTKGSIFSADQVISFEAKDKYAGVDKTFYSIDGSSYKEFSQPIELEDEKEYLVKYYSVDKVGNAESPIERSITSDFTAPVTSHNLSGASENNIISSTTKIKLSSTDELSGVAKISWSINGGKEFTYGSPLNFSYLKEGEHTLTYYATDRVKNIEEKKTYSFFMDKSAPLITAEITGDSFISNGKKFSSGRSKFKLVAVDNKAGVEDIFYSLDGRNYNKYEGPFALSGNNGTKYIRYYAVDKVGNSNKGNANSGKASNLTASYLDLKGPRISHKFLGPQFLKHDTVYISSQTKIQLNAYDSESGVKNIDYTLNNSDPNKYQEAFTIEKEGSKEIEVSAYDNVINVNKKSFAFVVDNTGPEISTTLSIEPEGTKTIDGKEYKIYSDKVALFISAVDDKTGYNKIYYSLNGSKERLYTGPIKGFKRETNIDVSIRATDFLNNEVTGETYFRVE